MLKKMSKLQKWLSIGAIVFVAVYLGAVFIAIQSRVRVQDRPPALEAARAVEQERHLMLPELLLPMGILLALAVSYLIVRRRNAAIYRRLDDDVEKTD